MIQYYEFGVYITKYYTPDNVSTMHIYKRMSPQFYQPGFEKTPDTKYCRNIQKYIYTNEQRKCYSIV